MGVTLLGFVGVAAIDAAFGHSYVLGAIALVVAVLALRLLLRALTQSPDTNEVVA